MLVLLLFIALSRSYSASLPIILDVVDVREVLQSGPPALQDHRPRTYFDIIWSCVSTLFICTWVAIHPNVPPRGEGHIRSLWRRIKLMLWTLVVPELILIWAYRQWAAARHIAELFEEEDWTPVHGHFLIMGGFSLVEDGVETVLGYHSFLELLRENNIYRDGQTFEEPSEMIAFPTITAEEIHDKARGDFLSKAIVIVQLLWFIVQCIARGKQGLALTEFELVTLALASLNGVMYYFWWDKPLGVKEPVRVYPKGERPAEKVIDIAGRLDRTVKVSKLSLFRRLVVHPFQQVQCSLFQLAHGFQTTLSSCGSYLSFIYHQLSLSTINEFLDDQRDKLKFPGHTYLWFLYLPILWVFINPVKALALPLLDIAASSRVKYVSHVPTFYAPETKSSADRELLFGIILPVVAAIFGALHCIAWNFHFPSDIEQLLWRIGSLTITLTPPASACIAFIIIFLVDKDYHLSLRQCVGTVMTDMLWAIVAFLGGAALVAYMLARLLLLTQAIMLLRKQPESAFYAINWANFLPHI